MSEENKTPAEENEATTENKENEEQAVAAPAEAAAQESTVEASSDEAEKVAEPVEAPTEAVAAEKKPEQPAGATLHVNGRKVATGLDPVNIFKKWPDFRVGDNVKVHYKITEGDKQRIQIYEGTVISLRGEGLGRSFIVRRVSHEVGVERIFPYHSPNIDKIEISRYGKVRRSRLFYLRHKSGKEGRIKESNRGYALQAKEKAEGKEKTSRRRKKKEKAPKATAEA